MNRVKELRLLNKLKQYELAEEVGVCKDYISLIEREKQTPGFKLAMKIANYFNVSVDYLNFFNEAPNKTFDDCNTQKGA